MIGHRRKRAALPIKTESFEGFDGGRPKWFRMVLFGFIY
jgi:hypothetical protein